ncbi:uncharacterized protein LOC119996913 [Tripterygium wilfordii]|uniref:uncharacterized protein LOC119996913 n=1 Tax=Tripterygium wilfordii TaxID=458696 RepID=UPI0018F81D51|nr:uncharacterized protein LOC119996913 [Tripterygium wilfordii]
MNFFGFSLLAFFFILTAILVSAQNNNRHEDVVKTVRRINKHVLLTIKEVPTQMLKMKKYAKKSRINNTNFVRRRLAVANVMTVNSTTSEFKKKQKSFQHQLPTSFDTHEHASVSYEATKVIYGVAAKINKAEPSVHGEQGCSQAHVRIKTGSGQNYESITAGWHVFPELNGDESIRLFLLWTTDGYQTKICYNYECEEFEQENDDGDGNDDDDEVLLGNILDLSSSQPDIQVNIWKDPDQQKWFLMINDELMGKWKSDTFPALGGPYTSVEWGGEVSNNMTEMGTGRFGHEGHNKACYIRNLEIMTTDNPNEPIQVPFRDLIKRETEPDFYNVSIHHNSHYIYFGGPGSNPGNP